MSMQNERMLTRYSTWANETIYAVCAQLPETEHTRARDTVFGTLLRTLGHGYAVGEIFRAHLERRAHGFTARVMPETTHFEALRAMQRELDAWYVDYTDALSEAEAAEPLHFEYIGGGEGVMTRAQMVLHVVNHASFHRGFIVDMLRRKENRESGGIAVPATDLTVFIRDHAAHFMQ